MAEFARVNGSTFYAVDTLYSVSQMDAYLITPGVDISLEVGVGGAIEQIIQEVAPLMYFVAANGLSVHVVMDNHHNNAATLQARIRNIGATAGLASDINLTGATVALANQMTFAAGGTGPVQTGD